MQETPFSHSSAKEGESVCVYVCDQRDSPLPSPLIVKPSVRLTGQIAAAAALPLEAASGGEGQRVSADARVLLTRSDSGKNAIPSHILPLFSSTLCRVCRGKVPLSCSRSPSHA